MTRINNFLNKLFIVTNTSKAYFAYLKSVTINKKEAKKIKKNSEDSFANSISQGVLEEFISYMVKENNTKIHNKLP